MKTKILILIAIISFSCEKEIIKGDLFFKLVNFTSTSGLSEQQATDIENWVNSKDKDYKNLSEDEKELIDYYKNVIKHNLLVNPYIQLETENGFKKIYLKSSEYDKIKSFELNELLEQSKKIIVELKATELEKNLYYSDEIILVDKVNGTTPWKK